MDVYPKTLSAVNDSYRFTAGTLSECSFQLVGSATMDVVAEGSMDGTTVIALQLYSDTSAVATASAAGLFRFGCSGLAWAQIRVSARTSGTFVAHVQRHATPTSDLMRLSGGGGGGGGGDASAALQTTGNASLSSIDGKATSTNTKLDTIAGHVDGVETAIAATNTKLDTVIGHVDGLETATASTNTKLDTANASLSLLAGYTDGLEAQLTTLAGHVDGVEGSLTAISGKLPAALVSGRLDVVVGAALPAGSANIGDVDVLTLPVTTAKYSPSAIGANIASTTLNSLADAANSGSINYDNSVNLDEFCDIEIVLGSFTSAAGGSLTLTVYTAPDGTNYEDASGGDNTYTVALTSGASAKRRVFKRARLFPSLCRFVITNNAGGTTAGSGNTLKVLPYNYKAV